MASHAPLAAKPASNTKPPPKKSSLSIHHSEAEWEVVRPVIERLYTQERRKLRCVMEIMEEKHNFKATIQMYKKRFTKWGFCKNKPRNTSTTLQCPKRKTVTHTTSRAYQTLHLSPKSSPLEAASLALLTSIQNWSTSFHESVNQGLIPPENQVVSPPNDKLNRYDPEQLSFAFRTILELVRCGKGDLAGRLTRRAFLDIEAMLHVEGPLFIWNVLEIMYHMVRLGQAQILDMLMMQLVELASKIHSATHPLITVLRNLQRAVRIWKKDSKLAHIPLLEQAWSLNADIVFNNRDSRLLLMYYRLVWDSSCLKLRLEQLDEVDSWFSAIGNKFPFTDSFFQEIVLSSRPLPTLTEVEILPPKDYKFIKDTSLSAIQHRCTMRFADPSLATAIRLGVLKSRVLEEVNDYSHSEEQSSRHQYHVDRFQARIAAYLMKLLVDIDLELGIGTDIATDRMRDVIAMREFGYSTTAPQVIHDMWQLETFLRQNGHDSEADVIRKETYERLEEYVDEVPLYEI
ncbi:Clr5 domain-containing protein [Fusarium acuminatum]|uniref:Clr5 domain-containing protein n=1 Tax=Fusarium acuminatum TaxID=5515 RepID=A0ABZ2WT87_9HYPO